MIYHVKLNLDKYIILNLLTYAMTSSVKSYDKMVHLLPKEPCDIILVNREALSPTQGRSLIRYADVSMLLRQKENPKFISIIKSYSCLVVIALTNNDKDVVTLFDAMKRMSVNPKYLFIETQLLNYNLLHNKTINYKVLINHRTDCCSKTTSLCPTLGKAHARVFEGSCPSSLESPQGKELKISFIGESPYIVPNPLGGSEIDLTQIFAQKFKFIPKFILEKSFGMFHRVGIKESEMGIGQSSFSAYRNKLVDFLPNMYIYEFVMQSKKPHEMASFDTIIHPFDSFTWIFSLASMLAVFGTLLLMQNRWLRVRGQSNNVNFMYEDLFLAVVFIPRRKLTKWIKREGFHTRKFTILKWIFTSHVLILGYKATLLSTLIPIRYSDKINTLEDMDRSGLPLIIPKGTAMYKSIAGDRRLIVQQIFNRSIFYQYTGTRENFVWIFQKISSGHAVGVNIKAGWTTLNFRNDYIFSRENIFASHTSNIVPKGSPLKALFQNTTIWLRDTGVLTKLRYDVLNPPILIPDPKVRNNQPLNNWQLGIIMIVYLVGLSISILTFIGELLKVSEVKPNPEKALEKIDIQATNDFNRTKRMKSKQYNNQDAFEQIENPAFLSCIE